MKAAAIIAALGIALIVTMGPAPASAQTTVVRECGGQYTVTHYNSDGSVKGVHKKQLSDEGTIYTAGKTWTLVEGSPDRFVNDGGSQLQVIPCDATPGSGTRGIGVRQVQGAQTSTVLVGNSGKTAAGNLGLNRDRAQAFTTGSNAAGYKLTSVDIAAPANSAVGNWDVRIASGGGSGPGSTVTGGDLSEPSSLTTGINNSFTSTNGVDLDPSTTYYIVIDMGAEHTATLSSTTDDTEDANPAAGWSIEDGSYTRMVSNTAWSSLGTHNLQIRVNGYAKVVPPLVSNTGQTNISGFVTFTSDRAQSFITGNASGYQLTAVKVALGTGAGTTPSYSVSIYADSSGAPAGSSLTTLNNPPSVPIALETLEFTASGNGIDLTAGTKYWVVIDVPASHPVFFIGATASGAEDAGAAAGWTIGNNHRSRGPTATQWASGTNTNALRIAIEGYAKTQTPTNPPSTTPPPVFRPPVFTGDDGRRVAPGPWISPRVNRADLSGTNVIVSMDKAVLLDTNYSTAQLADKFTVWVNGDGQAVVGASVSGYQVRLDLGSSFSAPPGARVRVNYARGPLLDAATGNTVGGFSLSPGPWTTPRPNRVYGTATGVVVSMDKPVQRDSSYSDSQIKAAFTVRVNDVSQTITKVSVSGRDISLQIESPPADGDKLAVDYTQGPLRDSTGMRILGFAYFGAGR